MIRAYRFGGHHPTAASFFDSFDIADVLAQSKRDRTWLLVRNASSKVHKQGFKPLKLADCPDAKTLVSKALSLCKIPETADYSVTIKFDWVGVSDERATMAPEPEDESSFKFLLDQVNDHPSWATGNWKCMFDVTVHSGAQRGDTSVPQAVRQMYF